MSSKTLKPKDKQEIMDRIRAEQLIDETRRQTVNAMSRAVLKRWGLPLIGTGVVIGLAVAGLVWSLWG